MKTFNRGILKHNVKELKLGDEEENNEDNSLP